MPKTIYHRVMDCFNTFPRRINHLVQLTEQFNTDFGDKGIYLAYKGEPEESIELTVSHFGELHIQREILAMRGADDLFSLTYKVYLCLYQDGKEEDIQLWYDTEEEKDTIIVTKHLVDFFLSKGKKIKAIPLLINIWPEVTKTILGGEWTIK